MLIRFALVALMLISPPISRAASYWAATNGTITGPGTSPNGPYLLASNLFYGSWSGGSLGPDDIGLFKGGTYVGFSKIDVHCNGTAGHPITFKSATNEWAKLDVQITAFQLPGFLVYRDLEIYNSDTSRVSSQTGMGLFPTDINRNTGFECYAPNVQLINCVIHDITRLGCYFSELTTNFLCYGNVIYNCGWISPDNSGEHAFYGQSQDSATMRHNISFNTSGNGYQLYGSVSHVLNGFVIDGNVQWGAAAISNIRTNRNMILGMDASGYWVTNCLLANNCFYYAYNQFEFLNLQIGRQNTNENLIATNNYFAIGLEVDNWKNLLFTNNTVAMLTNYYIIDWEDSFTGPGSYTWDLNNYSEVVSGVHFNTNSAPKTYAQWKTTTGFDANSTYAVNSLTNYTRVFTNTYQQCRANIVVYNWGLSNNVSVDVSGFLTNGCPFELRAAQNYFGPPCLSGFYNGSGLLSVPMTNIGLALPTGVPVTPNSTFPQFGAFVLLPTTNTPPILATNIQPVALTRRPGGAL